MEHIVQFAVGIDDERIKDIVEKEASKVIISDIERDVRNKIFSSRYYKRDATPEDELSCFADGIIRGVFEDSKDAIIEKAAKILAASFAKTKVAKETVKQISENALKEEK